MVAPKQVVGIAALGTEAPPHVTGIFVNVEGSRSGYAQSEPVRRDRSALHLERGVVLRIFGSREKPAVTDHDELATEAVTVP